MTGTPSPAGNWSARTPALVGLIGLVFLVGGFGSWATLAQISGAIVAPGRIEVDQNRQVVQHPDGGVVEAIFVDEGDVVAAEDVLIRLDDTELASRLAITETQLFEVMARRGRLEAERDDRAEITFSPFLLQAAAGRDEVVDLLDGQSRLMVARAETVANEVSQLEKRRGQIQEQINGIEAQQVALERQLALVAEELRDQQSLLDKGLTRATVVLALQREEAQLSGQVGELTAQKAQSAGRITEIEIEILKLGSARREEAISRLRDLRFREYELSEERRALIEQMSRLDISAPVSGIVYGLSVFTLRSVVRPADPILFLVPQDRPLVINAQIDPIHIDRIFPGQDVVLRFSGLDQRQTPELSGRVVRVSADTFEDERTRSTYYGAEIVLGDGELSKLPDGISLIPGMPVEVFIQTGERSPIAYLTKPLTDYFKKAFRE